MKLRILACLLTLTLITSVLAHDEQPLMISVCAYNASPWVEKNLDQIFNQQYTNFHVVYVDDASTDDTLLKVHTYVRKHQLEDKITIIANSQRQRKMKNIYSVFHDCPDETIIVQVDADDWLAHLNVFAEINDTYLKEQPWLTYGQFEVYPSGELGYCRPVPTDIKEQRDYRGYRFVYTHVRTFRAWLVKSIKLQDLITEAVPNYLGKFFPIANDNAIYFPMLEMCGDRFTFIDQVMYIHNHSNPNYGRLIDFELSVHARRDIRSRGKYPVLEKPVLQRAAAFEDALAHVIILSQANPEGLTCLLDSLYNNARGVGKVTVLYEAHNREQLHCYRALSDSLSQISFTVCNKESTHRILSMVVDRSPYDHIVLAQDTVYVKKPVDFNEYIQELERTFAYGYYLNYAHNKKPFYYKHIDKEMIPSQEITSTMCAWKFNCGVYALYNNIDMTLLRKSDVCARLASLTDPSERTMKAFLTQWHGHQEIDGHMVGLIGKEWVLKGKRTSIITRAIERPLLPSEPLQSFYKLQPGNLLESLAQEFVGFFE